MRGFWFIVAVMVLPMFYLNCSGGGFQLSDASLSLFSSSPNGPGSPGHPTAADQVAQSTAPDIFASAKKFMPADETSFSKARLVRLGRQQIELTLQTLLPSYVREPIANALPKDPTTRELYETDANLLNVNSVNLAAYQEAIKPLLDRIAANSSALINCSSQNNSLSCLQQQARAFVNKAFRSTASASEVDTYVNFFTTFYNQEKNLNLAASALAEVVITSPTFLFRAELPGASANTLSQPELLQAMSYVLTDAPPLRFGLESASAQTTDARVQLAKNLLAKDEAKDKLIRFFNAWLEIKDPDAMQKDPAVFPGFDRSVAQAVIDETNRFLNFHLSKAAPNLAEMLSSNEYFVSAQTAPLYGVWAAANDGSVPVKVDPTQRRGLFTQASFLASLAQSNETAVIKRGKMILNKALCIATAPPPNGVSAVLDNATGTTQRQRIESVTGSASCAGCHNYLNPFGFSLENYSAIGQWRTLDHGATIDPVVTVNFIDNKPTTLRTPVESVQFFTESLQFKQCFIRQLFRFYMGRDEVPSDDPTLRQMFYALAEGKDIKLLLDYLATSNRFAQRQ